MADKGKKADEATQKTIRRMAERGASKTEIAREANVSRPTAYKYAGKKSEDSDDSD